MAMSAKKDPASGEHAAANPMTGESRGETLTAEDVAAINVLKNPPGDVERARFDVAETLMDEETVALLARYRPFFETGGVDVATMTELLPRALELQRLERRLAAAQALVHRNLLATVGPVATAAGDIHRMIAATPEHSPLHAAFSLFEKRWQDTFRGGGRPAKGAVEEPPADPSQPPRDPR